MPKVTERKRAKRKAVSEYKNEKAQRYSSLDEFGAKELFPVLKEEDGMLKCVPCNKFVRFEKKADVRQHFLEHARRRTLLGKCESTWRILSLSERNWKT